MSPDSVFDVSMSSPGSWNKYAYVRNNPMNATDPTGHNYLEWWDAMNGGGGDNSTPLPTNFGETIVVAGLFDKPIVLVVPRGFGNFVLQAIRYAWFGEGTATGDYLPPAAGANDTSGNNGDSTPSTPSTPPNPQTATKPPRTCVGWARVLRGNPNHIGLPGAFPGIKVAAYSAAVIPAQWGGKALLARHLQSINGDFVGGCFRGVTEVIGGKSPLPGVAVRDALQFLYPGSLILELPSAPQDLGVLYVEISVPSDTSCPSGTMEAR
jgi:hypothetical protein